MTILGLCFRNCVMSTLYKFTYSTSNLRLAFFRESFKGMLKSLYKRLENIPVKQIITNWQDQVALNQEHQRNARMK